VNRRNEILSKVRSVSVMPTPMIEIIRLLQEPDVSVVELTRLIEYDPGLTSNVLRLANSAYFGYSRSIHSIKRAIVRLGIKNIFKMVVTSAVAPITQPAIKGYDLSPGELWKHSVAVAIGTDKLAMILGLHPPEYTFTAALLHDVGKIVLGTFVEVDAAPIMEQAFKNHVSFEVAEHDVLGIDHAEIGSVLLANWNLPHEIVEVVQWHHRPEHFQGDSLVVDFVHVSDVLCMMGGIGIGSDGLNYRLSNKIVSRLHLTKRMAEKVISQIHTGLNELNNIFFQQEETK